MLCTTFQFTAQSDDGVDMPKYVVASSETNAININCARLMFIVVQMSKCNGLYNKD